MPAKSVKQILDLVIIKSRANILNEINLFQTNGDSGTHPGAAMDYDRDPTKSLEHLIKT